MSLSSKNKKIIGKTQTNKIKEGGFKNTPTLTMNSLEPVNPNKLFIFAQILKNIYKNPTHESALL